MKKYFVLMSMVCLSLLFWHREKKAMNGTDNADLKEIPMQIEANSIAPNAEIKEGKLYLMLDEEDPISREPFREMFDEGWPVIIAVLTTKDANGKFIYRIYEAREIAKWLYGQNLEKKRLVQDAVEFKDPMSNQILVGPVQFYVAKTIDLPFKFVFDDIDFFNHPNDMLHPYKAALIKDPEIKGVYGLLGDYYDLVDSDLDLVERYYKKAVEMGDSLASSQLADLYYHRLEKYDSAERYYKKAIELGKQRALVSLARFYEFQEKFDQAEEYYKKSMQLGNAMAAYDLAIMYHTKLKKYDRAEYYYNKAKELSKNTIIMDNISIAFGGMESSVLRRLARLYRDQRRFQLAEEYYKKAHEQGGMWVNQELAELYVLQGKWDRAEQYYKKAYAQNPDAAGKLADLYTYLEKFNLAEEYLKKQNRVDSEELADLYKRMGNEQKAQEYYQKALEEMSGYYDEEDDDADYYKEAADLYRKMGNKQKAQEYYQIALQKIEEESDHKPEDSSFLEMADICRHLDQYDRAEEYYKQIIQAEPDDVEAYIGLALLYEKQGEIDLAEEYYKKAWNERFVSFCCFFEYLQQIKDGLARLGKPQDIHRER